ncbi:hypothetical protein JCGZ_26493 [Jatropha curcas]|uniref:Uncharacterized protein n=1 Tax=Jatropha curcas TaxID=180498 RepID=A0A067L822_JATCU|nr:hypothetical protein JCGZ_26493 [Jatropha curcas]
MMYHEMCLFYHHKRSNLGGTVIIWEAWVYVWFPFIAQALVSNPEWLIPVITHFLLPNVSLVNRLTHHVLRKHFNGLTTSRISNLVAYVSLILAYITLLLTCFLSLWLVYR